MRRSSRVLARRRTVCVSVPLSSPIRSTVPDASAAPVLPSSRRYFSDDDPALRTSTAAHVTQRSCAWMAVIATVLTMSRTSAPRDRSLTGLRSPCRTGPTASAPAERCTAL